MELKVQTVSVGELVPYANNAKIHTPEQVNQIAASMLEFGNCDPIAVWTNEAGQLEIVEGHGRVLALKLLEIETAPVIKLDHLSDEQRRAYTHVHNQTTLSSGFDYDALTCDLSALDYNWADFGFFGTEGEGFASFEDFEAHKGAISQGGSEEYQAFVDKFKDKKTTDDCYTPDYVYDAVAGWVSDSFGIDSANFVRPFYPGGDFETFEYPEGACVVDNPPFSILAKIVRFYVEKNIKFLIFAPTLTLLGSPSVGACYIGTGVHVTYENGAVVNTSFITNLIDAQICSAPTLFKAVADAIEANSEKNKIPKYEYPDEVVTGPMVARYSRYGIEFSAKPEQCAKIGALDSQKEAGKSIYGGGFLISTSSAKLKRKAEEKYLAALALEKEQEAHDEIAKQASATRWTLSEREREICRGLADA